MMKLNKQRIIRIFFGLELIIFFSFYLGGTNGIFSVMGLKGDIIHLNQEMVGLKREIEHLQSTVVAQARHPFFQEKIAREQLQMARADEEIYLM